MQRTPLIAVAIVLTLVLAAAAGTSPEDPDAVVFLRSISRGEGAPSKDAVEDLVVLAGVPKKDPYYEVVRVLEQRKVAAVVPFDPARQEVAFGKLARLRVGFVAVVVRPGDLDVNRHFEFLERASKLDDDPFVDFAFGYFTGATPVEAVAFAESGMIARKSPPARRVLEFGPTKSPSGLGAARAHKWADGFETWRLGHANDAKDVADLLSKAKGTGVYSAWGHGMPDGVAHGLKGRRLRESGLVLAPSLYFSGPCYCGVTGRWFGYESGKMVEKTIEPSDSFVLALIKARAAGVFAGLDPDRGETNHHELEHLLLTGEPLGMASKSTYDEAVVAYRRPEFVLPRYESGRAQPFRDIADNMISGGACRALFGDPAWAPFAKAGEDPFEVETEWTKKGLEVSWTAGADLGSYWMPVDVYRAKGGWTHRLRFRFELPIEKAKKLGKLEVLEVTKDGKPLPYAYPTAALEAWGGKLRVHGMLIFPSDPEDYRNRPLWGGREFKARFLFTP